MNHKFKEIRLELWTDNLGKHHVRIDNVVNNNHFNLLSTDDKFQAVLFYQDMYDLLSKHQEK